VEQPNLLLAIEISILKSELQENSELEKRHQLGLGLGLCDEDNEENGGESESAKSVPFDLPGSQRTKRKGRHDRAYLRQLLPDPSQKEAVKSPTSWWCSSLVVVGLGRGDNVSSL